jgi:hypothetical protein
VHEPFESAMFGVETISVVCAALVSESAPV